MTVSKYNPKDALLIGYSSNPNLGLRFSRVDGNIILEFVELKDGTWRAWATQMVTVNGYLTLVRAMEKQGDKFSGSNTVIVEAP